MRFQEIRAPLTTLARHCLVDAVVVPYHLRRHRKGESHSQQKKVTDKNCSVTDKSWQGEREREFFVDNLLVRIHLII